jgi:hypothetical protein
MAQFGSASALGAEGRRFKSGYPDGKGATTDGCGVTSEPRREAQRVEPTLDFRSEKDVATMCDAVGLQLHAVNRVWLGESGFAWEVAELIRQLGAVFERHSGDPVVRAEFGDGYTEGTLPREERTDRLVELVKQLRP